MIYSTNTLSNATIKDGNYSFFSQSILRSPQDTNSMYFSKKKIDPEIIKSIFDQIAPHINKEYDSGYDNFQTYPSFLSATSDSSLFPASFSYSYYIHSASHKLKALSDISTPVITSDSFNSVYPIAVRYTDGVNLFLVERPPFQANITYKTSPASSSEPQKSAYIWMPWTAMLLYIDPKKSLYSASLFFNDGPITSLDDMAIPCFHMNMYNDATMCLNQTSILLQQHLANTSSFDISTIYNFIINDYMSGGWNADLSVHVFDYLCRYSPTLKQVYENLYRRGFPEYNIKPAISPRTGRLSYKKYYSSYISYFSQLDMNAIIFLISSIKQEVLQYSEANKSNSGLLRNVPFKSYSSHIKDKQDQNDPTSAFVERIWTDSYFTSEVIVFIHPDLLVNEFSSMYSPALSSQNFISISDSLNSFTFNLESENIYNVLANEKIVDSSASYINCFFVDKDFTVSKIDSDFNFSFFSKKDSSVNV